jgi:anti-sigma regulatory factor (Ser/Thr protein kinase)
MSAMDSRIAAELSLELARSPRAPAEARAAVGRWSRGLKLPNDTHHTLLLLLSELVSNAVEHSQASPEAPITVAVARRDGQLRVTVCDKGTGREPALREPMALEGGFGLQLVDRNAARWGVDRAGDTSVWFELGA